ncbi:MAG: hypothetical protein ABSE73_18525 [Planctomycetota bacterium]
MSTNEPDDSSVAARPELETIYGKKAWHGVAGLLGGAALIALVAWLAIGFGFSTRSDLVKLIVGLGFAGMAILGANFRVCGAQFTPEGLLVWRYLFWVIGQKRLIVPEQLESVVLGYEKGKFTVCARLHDGSTWPVPGNWATVKDAQAVMDLCTGLYGVSAAVAISDQQVLEEAAAFAAAGRWRVRPLRRSRAEGERLLFAGEQGASMGEVGLRWRFLRSPQAVIAIGPGDLATNGPRWLLQKVWLRSRLRVSENEHAEQDVVLGAAFAGNKFHFQWTDAAGVCWSAVFTTEQTNTRTPFTMRFYRGLAEDAGKKAQREQVRQAQGEPVLVAVANGPAQDFTVDVADEQAWPWVWIALACVWLCYRPSFNFAKK